MIADRLPKGHHMNYLLTGFTQECGHRIFNFERVNEDRSRAHFSVSAELAMSQRYGISFQELPLLCRGFLEQRQESLNQTRAASTERLTYAEADMRRYADGRNAERQAAANNRKTPRRPANAEKLGMGWR